VKTYFYILHIVKLNHTFKILPENFLHLGFKTRIYLQQYNLKNLLHVSLILIITKFLFSVLTSTRFHVNSILPPSAITVSKRDLKKYTFLNPTNYSLHII
jgi:hypothetical protein